MWDMTTMAGKAALNSEVSKQAAVVAYADDNLLMMYVALAALPLALLLSKSRRGAGAPAAAAVAD
jgi:DHA2 family multidrug resistance protein